MAPWCHAAAYHVFMLDRACPRPDRRLNDALCPPFTSHGASMNAQGDLSHFRIWGASSTLASESVLWIAARRHPKTHADGQERGVGLGGVGLCAIIMPRSAVVGPAPPGASARWLSADET
eukprot:COSAG01_NODE_4353_length_5111_cov_52.320830_2_plen_120_part_00